MSVLGEITVLRLIILDLWPHGTTKLQSKAFLQQNEYTLEELDMINAHFWGQFFLSLSRGKHDDHLCRENPVEED